MTEKSEKNYSRQLFLTDEQGVTKPISHFFYKIYKDKKVVGYASSESQDGTCEIEFDKDEYKHLSRTFYHKDDFIAYYDDLIELGFKIGYTKNKKLYCIK